MSSLELGPLIMKQRTSIDYQTESWTRPMQEEYPNKLLIPIT